jgi:hypothetical protein
VTNMFGHTVGHTATFSIVASRGNLKKIGHGTAKIGLDASLVKM